MEELCFYFFKIPGYKGFKFHAQPQTDAYSCWVENHCLVSSEYVLNRFNYTHYVSGSFCDDIQEK